MKKVLIFGSTGMLGSKVLEVFSNVSSFKITATYRNKKSLEKLISLRNINIKNVTFIRFDLRNNLKNIRNIIKQNDILINCIGLIKPYINENVKASELATLTNIIFPINLLKYSTQKNKIYQIATDCVFSGEKKNYLETSPHDPKDIYGKTKSLGEISSTNFFNLRCSIIGEEIENKKSLLEWFKNLKKNSEIIGFEDHQWNGVTTKVFAELLKCIILKRIKIPNNLNIVPKNFVSKFQLLKYFQKYYQRTDIKINKGKSKKSINRTLGTVHKKLNLKIWNNSIYKKNLTIKEIINEI